MRVRARPSCLTNNPGRRLAGWLLLLAVCGWFSLETRASETPSASLSADERLARLERVGTLVYITAHPDDESGPILTYLARGLHARVVLLCLTRGEGGQNLVGSELEDDLGWIRTKELERAAAGYGAEVRFLGAPDFGYSKSVAETLALWNEERILSELVRQIRALRPLAVISHWTGTEEDGGGVHHQVAGLLARQAFALAGQEDVYPEKLAGGYPPWQPRYFLVRISSGEGDRVVPVPVDQPANAKGKTYEELGWEAFQHHRSQGLHLIQLSQLRSFRRYFLRVEATLRDGPPVPSTIAELAPDLGALPDLFPSVADLEEMRDRFAQTVALIKQARTQRGADKSAAALSLVQAAALLAGLGREFPADALDQESYSVRAWLDERVKELLKAAAGLAEVEFTATTDRATITPGEPLWIRLSVRARDPQVFQAAGFQFGGLRIEGPDWPTETLAIETSAAEQRIEYLQSIPSKIESARYGKPFLQASAVLQNGSLSLELTAPVRGPVLSHTPAASGPLALLGRLVRRTPESESEAYLAPVTVGPPVTLALQPPLRLLPTSAGELTRDWTLELEAHRPDLGKISAWLEVPMGWYTPLPQETVLAEAGTRVTLRFPLTLPGKIPPGLYAIGAEAGRGIHTYALHRRRQLDRDGQVEFTYAPVEAQLRIVNVAVPPGLRIGYIGFSDDPVPALLAQLGIGVDLLDERTLAQTSLNPYDAVVVSNRMYDAREDLARQTPRLLDYVAKGGTLVVEHQGRRWDPEELAPYPGKKSGNARVTDETAAVRMLVPEHPVLSFPNRIGEDDWKGWRQERGLYFWESWSEAYTPLLEMADLGEPPQRGALLYARYGQGSYLYCGLALFRQIRAGVPGGVRLFVNLLSQRRVPVTAPSPLPE